MLDNYYFYFLILLMCGMVCWIFGVRDIKMKGILFG